MDQFRRLFSFQNIHFEEILTQDKWHLTMFFSIPWQKEQRLQPDGENAPKLPKMSLRPVQVGRHGLGCGPQRTAATDPVPESHRTEKSGARKVGFGNRKFRRVAGTIEIEPLPAAAFTSAAQQVKPGWTKIRAEAILMETMVRWSDCKRNLV